MTSQASTAVVLSTIVINTVISGSLAQVWGMINGLQLIVHLPSMNIDFPENAMGVTENILSVATFDIPYLDLETITGLEPKEEIIPF